MKLGVNAVYDFVLGVFGHVDVAGALGFIGDEGRVTGNINTLAHSVGLCLVSF